MASQQTSRQRQNSTASTTKSLPGQNGEQSKAPTIQPKSSHVSDPFLQPFLDPKFNPAAYLNASLPPLQHAGIASAKAANGKQAVPLSELSSESQGLANNLNAHTTRLTNTLTQLTDDILRSGSRLAYEVELLRGEALAFSETLHETLGKDIEKFVPGGLQNAQIKIEETSAGSEEQPKEGSGKEDGTTPDEPDFVKQLRTLTLVRSRLDAVIKTFGQAMDFPFPPSELSVGSSFLSVSAPEPGKEQRSSEEKGQHVLKSLRDEISTLLADEDPIRGIEKAAERVAELKELTTVWHGTAEERGRTKFIETLAKMVEDAHRDLLKEMEPAAKTAGGRSRKGSVAKSAGTEQKTYSGGYGLISQLQKIRGGL